MVRAPADILSRRVGTCLDLALLYALHASNRPASTPSSSSPRATLIRRLLWLVERGVFHPRRRRRPNAPQAHPAAGNALRRNDDADWRSPCPLQASHRRRSNPPRRGRSQTSRILAVDVRRARKAQIRPSISRHASSAGVIEPKIQPAAPHELDAPPVFEEEQPSQPAKGDRGANASPRPGRTAFWTSPAQLRLLNFKEANRSRSTVPRSRASPRPAFGRRADEDLRTRRRPRRKRRPRPRPYHRTPERRRSPKHISPRL